MCPRQPRSLYPPSPALPRLSLLFSTHAQGTGWEGDAQRCQNNASKHTPPTQIRPGLPHPASAGGAVEVECIPLNCSAPASACAHSVVRAPCVISDLSRARTHTHTHNDCTPAELVILELPCETFARELENYELSTCNPHARSPHRSCVLRSYRAHRLLEQPLFLVNTFIF